MWFSTIELVGAPGLPATQRGIQHLAKREAWTRQRRTSQGGGWEYSIDSLPQATRAHLVLVDHYARQPQADAVPGSSQYKARWAVYDRAATRQKEVAKARARALEEWLVLRQRAGMAAPDATAAMNARPGAEIIDRATYYRWEKRTRGVPRAHWPAHLVSVRCASPAFTPIDPAAWDTFKADYLRLERPSANACHRRLARLAKVAGWTLPSAKAFLRRLRAEVPAQVICLARQGVEAFHRKYPAQQRDKSALRALEAVNADGHKFDVFVKWPDGTIGRPLMVAWQDIYSGKMLSYRVGQTENAVSVRLSLRDMLDQYGIPADAYLDNGRAFAAKWLSGGTPTRYRFKVKPEDPLGVLTALGVTIHWTTPYHGQSKPIERAFRDLCEDVAKHPAFAGAYTGNNPQAKPENYGSKAVPIAEFMAVLNQEMLAHNARPGRRSQVCGGKRSFDEAFAESYAAGPVTRATNEQLRECLMAAERMTAHRLDGSVKIEGNRYWCEDLNQVAGKSVTVRFDPDRLHGSVVIYNEAGEFLAEAACIQPVGFGDKTAAADHAKARASRKKAATQVLAAERRMTAAQVASALPSVVETPVPVPELVHLAPIKRAKAIRPPVRDTSSIDPDVLADGAAVIRSFDAAREERARREREDEELWERYQRVLAHGPADDWERKWAAGYGSLPDVKARIEFEEWKSKEAPARGSAGASNIGA